MRKEINLFGRKLYIEAASTYCRWIGIELVKDDDNVELQLGLWWIGLALGVFI